MSNEAADWEPSKGVPSVLNGAGGDYEFQDKPSWMVASRRDHHFECQH